MNNTVTVLSNDATNALEKLTNAKDISQADVATVLIARYEADLHAKIGDLRERLATLQKQNQDNSKRLEADIKNNVLASGALTTISNTFVEVVCTIRCVNVNFDKGTATVEVYVTTTNKSNQYSSYLSGNLDPIDISNYQSFTDVTTGMSEMCKVNTELNKLLKDSYDVSRKERAINAKLIEARMANTGIDVILNDITLTQLVKIN